MLAELITKFSTYLRENECAVPTSNAQEAIELLPYLDVEDRFSFQESLKQLWIKDKEDFKKYDLCFKEFFYFQIRKHLAEIEQEILKRKEKESFGKAILKLEKKQKKKESDTSETSADNWLKEQLEKKGSKSAQMMLLALENKLGEFFEKSYLSTSTSPSDLNELVEELMWEAITQEMPTAVFDRINQLGEFLQSIRKEVLKAKNISKESEFSYPKTEFVGMRKVIKTEVDHLKDRKIEGLSKEEIKSLSEHIQSASVHFLTKMSKLLRKSRETKELDLRRTMSKSLKTFGVPMELFYRKKKTNKTKIHLILDVSGSVVKSAEFLSLFAYLMHKRFPGQVRSFVFVGLLSEVTDYYKLEEPTQAIHHSLCSAPIDYKGYSNYDQALRMYEEKCMDDIDKDTIVIFLGDARNNRNDPNEVVVRKVADRARKVYWFNPEEKKKWDQGDSVISKYVKHCSSVHEVTTLRTLEETLTKITETA